MKLCRTLKNFSILYFILLSIILLLPSGIKGKASIPCMHHVRSIPKWRSIHFMYFFHAISIKYGFLGFTAPPLNSQCQKLCFTWIKWHSTIHFQGKETENEAIVGDEKDCNVANGTYKWILVFWPLLFNGTSICIKKKKKWYHAAMYLFLHWLRANTYMYSCIQNYFLNNKPHLCSI